MKPTSSIASQQATVDIHGENCSIVTKGRHDPCLLPRFVPIAESMVLITLMDHYLRHQAQCGNPEFKKSRYGIQMGP